VFPLIQRPFTATIAVDEIDRVPKCTCAALNNQFINQLASPVLIPTFQKITLAHRVAAGRKNLSPDAPLIAINNLKQFVFF